MAINDKLNGFRRTLATGGLALALMGGCGDGPCSGSALDGKYPVRMDCDYGAKEPFNSECGGELFIHDSDDCKDFCGPMSTNYQEDDEGNIYLRYPDVDRHNQVREVKLIKQVDRSLFYQEISPSRDRCNYLSEENRDLLIDLTLCFFRNNPNLWFGLELKLGDNDGLDADGKACPRRDRIWVLNSQTYTNESCEAQKNSSDWYNPCYLEVYGHEI